MNTSELKVAINGKLDNAGLACLQVVETKAGYDIVLQLRRDVTIKEAREAIDNIRIKVGNNAPACFTVVQTSRKFSLINTPNEDEKKQNPAG